jgi:PleD family two-component response regulator
MITSLDDALTINGAFDAGAISFVSKPINLSINIYFFMALQNILKSYPPDIKAY